MQLSYKQINNICGFFCFGIATIVYTLTIEPTASFWDCGEFITSAYKLEVGHPPGAPFFMLTANLFTQLTNEVTLVARYINYMSAFMSAATILLLFFTITRLVRKLLIVSDTIPSTTTTWHIMACGFIGSLVYTFSDTFWFSAVEAEVYAYSSFFTALVFWLILKWEEDADNPHSDRWLILIAYLIGLSIGIHLLNLLCLPAIVLVYYYRRNSFPTYKGTIGTLFISAVLVAIVLYGIVPGVIKISGWFELFFVNTLGFSFNSGLLVYVFLLIFTFVWGIWETFRGKSMKRSKLSFILSFTLIGIPFYGYGTVTIFSAVAIIMVLFFLLFSSCSFIKDKITFSTLNTLFMCLAMILIGYSSYAIILIRSTANTPMDQNSPEDVFALGYYLGREQYGDRPLFYGKTYSSERKIKVEDGYCIYETKEGKPNYARKPKGLPGEKDKYINTGNSVEPEYEQKMFFPRMHSETHAKYGSGEVNLYEEWVNVKGRRVMYDKCSEMVTLTIPTQLENLKFLFTYQLGFMYWRYFFWNFVGRQNDIQGHGGPEHGNWITGIPFIDDFLIGNSRNIPTELIENKGRNVYYGFPLLLGLLGMIWQFKQKKAGKESFLIVFFLFFMTGIAIVLYLNQTPMQARERDYAYAGSFYAFSIWIGMGCAAVYSIIKRKLKTKLSFLISSLVCLFVPFQMASQNWDDHDRSGRYSCCDFGYNYLTSAQEGANAVVFTYSDNDTFPLWYSQEVESYRTDVRVCNLGYLQFDWYINPMKRPYYDSPPLPVSWEHNEYITGTNDFVLVRPEMKQQIDALYEIDREKAVREFGENPYELKNILQYWVRSDNPQMRMIPTDSVIITLDKEVIRKSGMYIPDELKENLPQQLTLSFKNRRYLTKSDLMMLEIIMGCNWERPVYICITASPDSFLCFEDNFIQEGLLYRITPFNTHEYSCRMDVEKTYELLMNKFEWGGIVDKNVYVDETILRMYAGSRRLFVKLANELVSRGDYERAKEVLDYSREVIPPYQLNYDYQNAAFNMAECYFRLNDREEGEKIIKYLADKSVQYINWYMGMKRYKWNDVVDNCRYHFYLLNESIGLMEENKVSSLDYYIKQLNDLYHQFSLWYY